MKRVDSALLVWQFLAKEKEKHIVSKTHYSPHLAPCNVFLFHELKCSLNVTHFQSIQDTQKSVTG
jgi:hypothetical protein